MNGPKQLMKICPDLPNGTGLRAQSAGQESAERRQRARIKRRRAEG